jgi:ketosteroid isomerase-like protein
MRARFNLRRVIVVCLALWCATSAAEGEQLRASDVAAIEALASGYSKWVLAGDFQQWAELYHPDAIRMNPGQPVLEGREAIYQWATSLGLVAERSKHEMTITEVEGMRDIAFMRGAYHAELVRHAAPRQGAAYELALENPRGRAYRITLAPGRIERSVYANCRHGALCHICRADQ